MTFLPAPLRPRHDGWTPVRQAAFIAALAGSRSVTAAAAAVGITPRSAYLLRRRPEAAAFAAAWDAALAFTDAGIGAATGAGIGTGAVVRVLAGVGAVVEDDALSASIARPCSSDLLVRLLGRAAAWKVRNSQSSTKTGTS